MKVLADEIRSYNAQVQVFSMGPPSAYTQLAIHEGVSLIRQAIFSNRPCLRNLLAEHCPKVEGGVGPMSRDISRFNMPKEKE